MAEVTGNQNINADEENKNTIVKNADKIEQNGNSQNESVEKMIESLIENGQIADTKTNNSSAPKQPASKPDTSKDGINSVIHAILDALQESAAKKAEKEKATSNIGEILLGLIDETNTLESPIPAEISTEEEWKIKEKVLLDRIAQLEETQADDIKLKALELKLKLKCEENDILKAKSKTLETELRAVLSKPNGKNKDMVAKIKKQHEELLTKARGMIFDKTKMIKNQELQIEALASQVTSLKDVVSCTKDLLNIRNLEVIHLQERLDCMDLKIRAEKDRHNLMMKKMDTGTKVNEELKKEYLKQMELFKTLKGRYEEKFKVLEGNQKETPSTSQSENDGK